ncbi:Tetratricopeptide repeat protein 25 [Frankliniella fusca]|uniref:Outer dynein arm-docking complex subunit 4 n=1 Tax=Frankliniella fusca TaxID=407009 RepID=A0AAE1GQT1_9NEOP|nr:Tetratricopeptide repeat protein 25 [Frankliniella fusca]
MTPLTGPTSPFFVASALKPFQDGPRSTPRNRPANHSTSKLVAKRDTSDKEVTSSGFTLIRSRPFRSAGLCRRPPPRSIYSARLTPLWPQARVGLAATPGHHSCAEHPAGTMLCTSAPVITVNEGFSKDDGGELGDGDVSEEDGEDAGSARKIRDIGQSKLADLARRSVRMRRRVHLQLHRQRRRQLLQLEEAKQIERLRRDKDILTNFMRLRLYETQSSFSGSEVASSSGLDPSSDSDRRAGASPTPSGEAGEAVTPGGEDEGGRRDAGSVSGVSASIAGGALGGGGGGGSSVRSRRREDIRNFLRQRRHRRRLMLLSYGEGGVEQYTDKTRNAAVVMGEKDIKLSLKQQRRALAAARGFSLPACAQPSGLTALARAHRRAGQARAALQLAEQALLLDPVHRAALLERCQCYQQLGQPRLALLDAEDALDLDRTSAAAFLHKARALYAMGHFEKALVMFHRGCRLRPENPACRKGIQRCREAIMNIIGCLPMDFALSSCERLVEQGVWPDEESSVGSARRAAELGAMGLGALPTLGAPPGGRGSSLRTRTAAAAGAGAGADDADGRGATPAAEPSWEEQWAEEHFPDSAVGALEPLETLPYQKLIWTMRVNL